MGSATDEAGERRVQVGRGGTAADQVRGALMALADGQLRCPFGQASLARLGFGHLPESGRGAA